jgi:hypothetical protein
MITTEIKGLVAVGEDVGIVVCVGTGVVLGLDVGITPTKKSNVKAEYPINDTAVSLM